MRQAILRLRSIYLRVIVGIIPLLFLAASLDAAVTAQYIRLENPTGHVMQVRQIEVFSNGANIVLNHGEEMITGSLPIESTNAHPTVDNTIRDHSREGGWVTNGDTDASHRGVHWQAFVNPADNAPHLCPWFEIDLGRPMPIDRIVVYGSMYPQSQHLDKGHRVLSAMDPERRVVWAVKWDYYDQKRYPKGVFDFATVLQTAAENPVVGLQIPPRAPDWVPMGWLLLAEDVPPLPDAAQRRRRFAERDAPANVTELAGRVFRLLDDRIPELAEARRLHASGQDLAALAAWKRYWFAKMRRANLHAALHNDYVTYAANGDDLMQGLVTVITPRSARAIRYAAGEIPWIDLPKDAGQLVSAIDDCERKAQAGKVSWPLLAAYRQRPDVKYLVRWSEIMDDWALNFFADAAKTPYEVERLFTFNPCLAWATMLEDLADTAQAHPELIDRLPATTFARVQLICLEKYTTAWARQSRETVFNHDTGGIYAFDAVLPYIDEWLPGQRARQEWQQAFERWITLGNERDGSLTEIGDEGHMEIPTIQGFNLQRAELTKPAWYTPGWRNQALQWYDSIFYHMFRHLAPGGYEHRDRVNYRPYRWSSTTSPYFSGHPKAPPLIDRDREVFGNPEIRRMLGAWGHIATGVPALADPALKPLTESWQASHDLVAKVLGDEKPEPPHVVSDWMPYSGTHYFRGSWADDAPFLCMEAWRSRGGATPILATYGMFRFYDYRFPLLHAQPIRIDGLQPQPMYGHLNLFQPGTKTQALCYAEEKPAHQRWLSSARYDFGEAVFDGAYQNFPGFRGGEYGLQQLDPGPAVTGVRTVRQILQLRGSRLFLVADTVAAGDGKPHRLSIDYQLSLMTRQKDPSRPFGADQLVSDAHAGILRSENPDAPSVALYQFADLPLAYERGREEKPTPQAYAQRLKEVWAVADQGVQLHADGNRLALVTLIASREAGAADRIAAIEPLQQPGTVGFHARLRDGGEVWYQRATAASAALVCGPARATASALLVARDATGISGILLDGADFVLAGAPKRIPAPDVEFVQGGGALACTVIDTPIDPVRFLPARDVFTGSQRIEMVSDTPGVEIRYTTDGTQPTRASQLYGGPLTITATTEFAARAYRLGGDGKPLPAEDFEINGTRFTVPSYASFHQQALLPAVAVAEVDLKPGLDYDFIQASWWTLFASAHWLPATSTGIAERELDLGAVHSDQPYAMRYHGWIRIPADGTYTFHAPHELTVMDGSPSYDLRVYVDGQEWYLIQWWHAHGTWSIPLAKGMHRFQVDYADARSTPWIKTGIWNYYPRPWAIRPGNPSDLRISGPGIDQPVRIPKDWLLR